MRARSFLGLLLLAVAVLPAARPAAGAAPAVYLPMVLAFSGAPTLGGCPLFPADNEWNRDISADPVDPNSQNYINFILQSRTTLHPDFGSFSGYGIPFLVVPASEPLRAITFTAYGNQSDPGPYPIPLNAPIEGGSGSTGDRHVLVVRSEECKLYELYRAFPQAASWNAASGAVWDLRSNAVRPAGWTSADAAGLPILPGLVRYDEVLAGAIHHALRVTVQTTQRAYIYPARHWASSNTEASAPPMGLRLRLKAGYNLSGVTGQSRVILEALKRYGLIVADNGSSWFITGATDPRWDDDYLNQIKGIPGSAFEVVQIRPDTLCTPASPPSADCDP